MNPTVSSAQLPRVCAVSYLNTAPLIWGFTHSRLASRIRLEFALPSECADRVRAGTADIGILPVIEIERQGLQWLPGTGIACRGAVRSILLLSKVPLTRIRTLAADSGSRTSVVLARILLAERYGVEPDVITMPADLHSMLAHADAALIIGDPALRLDPQALRCQYEVLDLGEEWTRLTNHSMIFALWSGRKEKIAPELENIFLDSCLYGLDHIEHIARVECPPRGIAEDLGRTYLTHHIVSKLEDRDYEGMRLYLHYARQFDTLKVTV